MKRRQGVKSVLHNFLGTFTSRYSDFNGYWLFGFLVDDLEHLRVDLIRPCQESNDPTALGVAERLAVQKFAEQVGKARIAISCVRQAHLDMTTFRDTRPVAVNGHVSLAYRMTFVVRVVTNVGKVYETGATLFVAPHNPRTELRSART
jgi:hypothetical protein